MGRIVLSVLLFALAVWLTYGFRVFLAPHMDQIHYVLLVGGVIVAAAASAFFVRD